MEYTQQHHFNAPAMKIAKISPSLQLEDTGRMESQSVILK